MPDGERSAFSPQAWGCTAICNQSAAHRRRFPHRRGGVPALYDPERLKAIVFPTGVGVYRLWLAPRGCDMSFPHRRGGVPDTNDKAVEGLTFSPQAWGCTAPFAVSL